MSEVLNTIMLKKIFHISYLAFGLLFFIQFVAQKSFAQSIRPKELGPQLVRNNGFEEIKRIPFQWYFKGEDFNIIMKDWESPTQASPDIYTLSTKVPEKWAEKGFGKSNPYKGRNMIGLTLYGCGFGKPHCREYVQSLLKEPLVIGQKYYFECWVKPLPKSLRCNNIAAFFSVFDIDKPLDGRLKCKPQVEILYIVEPKKSEWTHVDAIFTAQTAGNHIVLGNFKSDSLTKVSSTGISDPLNYAYYYFDEIGVYKIPPFIEIPSEEGTFEDCCIKKGDTILLKNIYFDFDKSTLRPASNVELSKLLRLLGNYPNMKLNIAGHTDVVGKYNYNVWLSRKRAQAVMSFLTDNGIDEERLSVAAMSYSQPAATNKTIDGRQLNRRVEMHVIED